MIDAHTQIDHQVSLEKVLPLMEKAGISRVILTARGKRDLSDIVQFARQHPDRITASIRLKGNNYSRNKPAFYKKLQKRIANPAFGAMAEALVWHEQKGKKAGRVALGMSSPQVLAAYNAASKAGWPFVVHIEFASAGKRRKMYMRSLEGFLRDRPDHPIVLIHMGQLDSKDVARLLAKHSHLYFMTSRSNPVKIQRSKQPWLDLFRGREIAPAWQKLMIAYSDRFILAFDNVWAEDWGAYYVQQARLWQKALRALPPNVAHAIGHRNAERLWQLPSAQ
jgi:predicted TIM-barrel fold metal-dependent hydrolase